MTWLWCLDGKSSGVCTAVLDRNGSRSRVSLRPVPACSLDLLHGNNNMLARMLDACSGALNLANSRIGLHWPVCAYRTFATGHCEHCIGCACAPLGRVLSGGLAVASGLLPSAWIMKAYYNGYRRWLFSNDGHVWCDLRQRCDKIMPCVWLVC